MKVILEKEDKKYITLEEAPVVREIISEMKEDMSTPEEYAKMAIRAAYNGNVSTIEVMKVSAKIFKNSRIWNSYNNNSKDIDVYIEAMAYIDCNEFAIVGAYLTDIWQITGDNNKEIASHMYIRRFKESK